MRLKSLDIKGFKSFADKTQILLDHPITGIVGPNGCGKSNIVDAIRWVIGEHKIKSLRSDNLDDLVFNGSKSRAASGMAEVSLTFENTRNLLPTEFSTVTITRKFYKSGESEYRLNDVSCRLKDIHNLFLDTGVSNDSYAIIELGMVDDIIKDKDGSRRRMLEQAAGISIYKTRKKEAKLKLDATQQDLARIEDLLYEIGNNLRTLESQARKAERYLQIKNDYREISIELAKVSLETYNDKYQSLQEQHDAELDKKMAIETEIAGDEAEIEANKLKLSQKEQELNSLQKQFNELLNRIRQMESDKKLAAQRLDHLQDREKNLNSFLENAGTQMAQIVESCDFAKKQINTETDAQEELRSQLESLQDTLDEKREVFELKKQTVEEKRNSLQQFQRKQFDAEKKVAVADTSVLNLQRSIQQTIEEQKGRALQSEKLKQEQDQTQQLLIEKQEDLRQLLERQELIKHKILESQELLESLRTASIEENRKLDSRINEHELLKSLVDSLEGYPESIKYLKKNKDWNSSAPLLSDIFVVDETYRTALENVLDNYLNYYVVQDISEAIAAIHLLEKNKKGKANFFILEQVKDTPVKNPKPTIPANWVPALDVVQIDPPYSSLAQHLLGNVYICPDTDSLSSTSNEVVVAVQNGKAVRGQYTIGGGSIGLFEGNKIGRAKNLERLANDIDSLTSTTQKLKKEIENTQFEIAGFNQELNDKAIDNSREQINKLKSEIQGSNHRLDHLQQLDQAAEDRLANLQNQLGDTQADISDTRTALSELNEELEEMQAAIQLAATEFATVEQDYNFTQQQFNNQHLLLTRQQSKIDNLKQELVFRNNQLSDLQIQVDNNQGQLKETMAQISETSGKLHFGDNELYDLLIRKEKDEQNLNEKDRQFYEFRNALSEHESKISRQRRNKEQAEVLINSFKEKLSEMKVQVAGLKERLHVEFRIELESILNEPRNNELNEEELITEAERLKKRLDNMGEINPTAIEAFSEIKVRHDFIVEQKTDLESARDTLIATIEEVEQTA
ncbi:MAG TPA: chromosome segregation protein SMC, partial [Flavobacterium sp.]|nr:chromosome segregation protein SMC [Flavobacterium sp.]